MKAYGPRAKQLEPEVPCRIKGCDHSHYSNGTCKKHYEQIRRNGRITDPSRERGSPRICLVRGCKESGNLDWHCRKHARQLAEHGRLTPELEQQDREGHCSVSGCKRAILAKGMCGMHYKRKKRGAEL